MERPTLKDLIDATRRDLAQATADRDHEAAERLAIRLEALEEAAEATAPPF